MAPVIIVLIACWAFSGAAASLKAAFASDGPDARDEAAFEAAPTGPDLTFGQRRREAYRRWRKTLRRGMPGTDGGRSTGDIFGDAGAATLAGAALFATGFASGATWLAGKLIERRAAERLHDRRRPRTTAGTRPRPEPRPSIPLVSPRRDDGPDPEGTVEAEIIDGPRTRTGTATNDDIEDAEIVYDPAEDGGTPTAAADPEPALTSNPEPDHTPPGDAMPEILTIHHLFGWGDQTATTAANALEQAVIRRNSAMQRAETAIAAAAAADSRAVELEAAIARFSALNMDPASLAAMHAAHEAAAAFAAAERRRADAEAATAAAAQDSAAAADVYRNAVLAMNATVHAHQSPHAEAQAATGNAAAHSSVLEVS